MSANRMTRHFGHEAALDEMLKKHAAGRRGRPADTDTVRRVRAAVTCLLHDEGGWTCGKNGQSVPVSMGIPTVRVASITVGGRGKQG